MKYSWQLYYSLCRVGKSRECLDLLFPKVKNLKNTVLVALLESFSYKTNISCDSPKYRAQHAPTHHRLRLDGATPPRMKYNTLRKIIISRMNENITRNWRGG